MMSSRVYGGFDSLLWPELLGILLAGFALGLMFFYSLRFSTGKILHSQHPVAWLVGGFLLRMTILLPALYWLTDARWEKWLVCVGGFFIARLFVLKRSAKWQPVGVASAASPVLQGEGKHASES